jgi:hypothetical protein
VAQIVEAHVLHYARSLGSGQQVVGAHSPAIDVARPVQTGAGVPRWPSAPKLWKYLTDHSEQLDGRKSSIYRNRARFCILGVGPYSFTPYKVAISAMHKEPVFRLVAPVAGRPAVFDDVTYFASFEDAADAAVFASTLQGPEAQALLDSLIFTDSKRPITKKLLQRIDTSELARISDAGDVSRRAVALLRSISSAISEGEVAAALDRLRGNVIEEVAALDEEAVLF